MKRVLRQDRIGCYIEFFGLEYLPYEEGIKTWSLLIAVWPLLVATTYPMKRVLRLYCQLYIPKQFCWSTYPMKRVLHPSRATSRSPFLFETSCPVPMHQVA